MARPPHGNAACASGATSPAALIEMDQAIALAGLRRDEIALGEWRLLQAAFMEADPVKFERALEFVVKRRVTA